MAGFTKTKLWWGRVGADKRWEHRQQKNQQNTVQRPTRKEDSNPKLRWLNTVCTLYSFSWWHWPDCGPRLRKQTCQKWSDPKVLFEMDCKDMFLFKITVSVHVVCKMFCCITHQKKVSSQRTELFHMFFFFTAQWNARHAQLTKNWDPLFL